jgi:hypothetical protein
MDIPHDPPTLIAVNKGEWLLRVDDGREWSCVVDDERWRCFGEDWHMILCENVEPVADAPGKVNVLGMVNSVKVAPSNSFPYRHPGLCLYVQLKGGKREGSLHVEIDQNGKTIFRTKEQIVDLGDDPHAVNSLTFRIKNCEFPEPDLYWVQTIWNDEILGEQPLRVR